MLGSRAGGTAVSRLQPAAALQARTRVVTRPAGLAAPLRQWSGMLPSSASLGTSSTALHRTAAARKQEHLDFSNLCCILCFSLASVNSQHKVRSESATQGAK